MKVIHLSRYMPLKQILEHTGRQAYCNIFNPHFHSTFKTDQEIMVVITQVIEEIGLLQILKFFSLLLVYLKYVTIIYY